MNAKEPQKTVFSSKTYDIHVVHQYLFCFFWTITYRFKDKPLQEASTQKHYS